MQTKTQILRKEAEEVLTNNILPYWINKVIDNKNGEFIGRITGNEEIITDAPKGAVLNARILWTYSAAYRLLKKEEYLHAATRAKKYLLNYFYDNENGGIYWLIDYKGNPIETKKQIYAQGFAIYGLSEYYRATGDEEALEYAKKLFYDIEKYSFDKEKNGYLEALTKDWKPISDMRLSDKDENVEKTMNTHLHILEPYTNLYRVWKDKMLKNQLKNLIEIFLDKIVNSQSYHLNLFFDANWKNTTKIISFGHDIEGTWLLYEAALVLEDKEILNKVRKVIPNILTASLEGFQPDGSMIYEKEIVSGHEDRERHWWVQAETVVGLINHYKYYFDEKSLEKAIECWNFIKNNIIDYKNGEWFWSVYDDGKVNRKDDKAGVWKCPYHNGRMCMELMERFEK
ncbi:Cellobiose 2-epimerase [uncultured Paludibacter sp.]|uniref:Cellobiose 2-epimerase n=1 Tax=uncultured Paludibacter sp. TaxID=497635 RepID=A0A653AAP4_9BACT|nr:Cellobiose 2-epimerase [uncultured Paludibacter sp.]